MNLAACGGLQAFRRQGTWFRAIGLQHVGTPLSVLHTRAVASRFSPGHMLPPRRQFPVLYLAEDQTTALFEYGALLGTPFVPGRAVPNGRPTPVLLNVDVDLQRVVDLCDRRARGALGTTVQELTGDWQGYQLRRAGVTSVGQPTGHAPTQNLGWELSKSGFEGFLTISAKVSTARNLVVFPANLRKGSRIGFAHPDGVSPPVVIER